jgi:hypothetical protein
VAGCHGRKWDIALASRGQCDNALGDGFPDSVWLVAFRKPSFLSATYGLEGQLLGASDLAQLQFSSRNERLRAP